MSKQTHKLQTVGAQRVADVLKSARSMRQAAAKLGVNVSTVSRWRKNSLIPGFKKAARTVEPTNVPSENPKEWGERVRKNGRFTVTGLEVIRLAEGALHLAQSDVIPIKDRLMAMRQFQSLLKSLNLDAAAPEADPRSPNPFEKAFAEPKVRRSSKTIDPRIYLRER